MTRLAHTDRLAYISRTCRWFICGCRRSVKTTTEEFHQSGHLMAPSRSLAHTSMCSTILAAVGRHRYARSTEAMQLHVSSGAHVLVLCRWPRLDRWSRVSCVGSLGRLVCGGLLSHIARLAHAESLANLSLGHWIWSTVASGYPSNKKL